MEPRIDDISRNGAQAIHRGFRGLNSDGSSTQAGQKLPEDPNSSRLEPREATELEQLHYAAEGQGGTNVGSDKHDEQLPRDASARQLFLWHAVTVCWSRQISIVTHHESSRDHWGRELTLLSTPSLYILCHRQTPNSFFWEAIRLHVTDSQQLMKGPT